VFVDLVVRDDRLEVCVNDDGCGLPADVRPGIGMHSIAERAADSEVRRVTTVGSRLQARVTLPVEVPR
jgi:signal transduction histidine kinase